MKKNIIKTQLPAFLGLLLSGLLLSCQPQSPVIHTINPQIGMMGEPVTITGDFFGVERGESYVTVADIQPTGMSYLDWQDNRITVRMPELGEGGLVYVHVNGRKSNGVLFANQMVVPMQIQDSDPGLGPVMSAITPQSGTTGTLVSITGTGFGSSHDNGGVFFTWEAETPPSAPAEAQVQRFIEAVDFEFGYELWTDREIRIRVPDGAMSGNMEVRTVKGSSLPMVFNITGRPGSKTFRDKRSYTINYSVSVKTGETEPPDTLYLWIPRPAVSASQRDMELLSSSIEPFIDQYRGTSLFKLDNLAADSEEKISLSWKVDVYSVETAVAIQSIQTEADSSFKTAYTQSSPQLPAADPRIQSQAAAIAGRERNPYMKARRIYEWMLDGDFSWVKRADGDMFTMLETKQADPYLAALLYCTLLRAGGVPCQPVAGALVSQDRQTMHHYWAEFWIDGFGWIPVDPAMGAGAVSGQFNTLTNRADYYFGSVDSRRIAFSRGFVNLLPMDPRGRTVTHNRSYSLQNIWEESVGGTEAYSSLWGGITITGMYAQ